MGLDSKLETTHIFRSKRKETYFQNIIVLARGSPSGTKIYCLLTYILTVPYFSVTFSTGYSVAPVGKDIAVEPVTLNQQFVKTLLHLGTKQVIIFMNKTLKSLY